MTLSGKLIALLIATLPAMAAAQTAPSVYAAWSQIIGHTDIAIARSLAPPSVQLRFAIDTAQDCGKFRVWLPGSDHNSVKASGLVPASRPQILANVGVCSIALPGQWKNAQLYRDNGDPVRLVSKVNFGNEMSDLDDSGQWRPGHSDNAFVVVPGKAWIGRNSDLNIVTLGDTGCRGGSQFCDAGPNRNGSGPALQGRHHWPLENLSLAASTMSTGDPDNAPDLVIHVGDYRYFHESPTLPDSWVLWRKDFFPAAQPLMLAAPWVFARGNHEGCPPDADLKYGLGYFQFFGTDNENGVPLDCNNLAGKYMKPWYFDVLYKGAGGNNSAHRFVVLDANDYKRHHGVDEAQARTHYATAKKISDDGPVSSWWVWHSPAVQRIDYYKGTYGDSELQLALLDAAGLDKPFGTRFCGYQSGPPCRPAMFLLGHQHLYQDVTFDQNGTQMFPKGVIVGHGGVSIRDSNPAPRRHEYCLDKAFPLGSDQSPTVPGVVGTVAEHGMLYWTRSQSTLSDPIGWTAKYTWSGDMAWNNGTLTSTSVPGAPPGASPEPCNPVN